MNASESIDIQSKVEGIVPTGIFRIYVSNQYSKPLRAIFDSGAQVNLISYEMVKKLKIDRTAVSHKVCGVGGQPLSIKRKIHVPVYHYQHNVLIENIEFTMTSERLSAYPTNSFEMITEIPDNVLNELAVPQFNISSDINAVFGIGILAKHTIGSVVKLQNGMIAQQTTFGWVIFGEHVGHETNSQNCSIIEKSSELNYLIQKLWEVNEIHKPLILTKEDQYCMDHFQSNVIRVNGQYVVSIPLKPDAALGESKHMALRRLHQVEAKFQRDHHYHQQYVNFMREYITLGHMVLAEPLKPGVLHCYICHHAVAVDRKFRVVFDGSVPTTNGRSLNDIQFSGPKLQHDLADIIMNFRMGNIALTADIVKMYRQVYVNESQWDLQRILWRENPSEPIQEYWLKTITYGEAAAPFMAVSALIQCANDFAVEYPIASEVIKNNFYMDDLLVSVDSITEAIKLKQELTQLLAKGGFTLAKWTSNSSQLIDHDSDFKSLDEVNSTSVLGLSWNYQTDEFQFKVKNNERTTKLTKRIVTSEAARTYI